MDLLQRIVSKAWCWFIIGGAVILIEIILKEHIQGVIDSNPSSAPYLISIQIVLFAIPLGVGVYLATKDYEEKK